MEVLNKVAERLGKDLERVISPLVITKEDLRSIWNQLVMDKALLIWGDPIKR